MLVGDGKYRERGTNEEEPFWEEAWVLGEVGEDGGEEGRHSKGCFGGEIGGCTVLRGGENVVVLELLREIDSFESLESSRMVI